MKIDHLVIQLADLEVGMQFYDRLMPILGFKKQRDHVFGNEQDIFIDFRAARDAEHCYQRHAPGLNHLGLVVPSCAELRALQQGLADHDLEVPEIQSFSDGKALFIKDPEGMRIEVGCYQQGQS